MDRRRKIIFWQGLIAISGGAFFLVYLTEWNSVAVAVAVVAVATHFLWRWGVNKIKL
jgi:membrane protein implicated in regulation of membrane protease activity